MGYIVTVNVPDERLSGMAHTHIAFDEIESAVACVVHYKETHGVTATVAVFGPDEGLICGDCNEWAGRDTAGSPEWWMS